MDIPPELKALAWPAAGVVGGSLMRWSRAAHKGGKWVRMALLDTPAMLGLTLLSSAVAGYLKLDSSVAAGVGVGVGFLGCEVVNILLKRFFPEKDTAQ